MATLSRCTIILVLLPMYDVIPELDYVTMYTCMQCKELKFVYHARVQP